MRDDPIISDGGTIRGSAGDFRPAGRLRLVYRTVQNGTEWGGYEYRARSYPWAQQKIAEAEAQHGPPPDDPEIAQCPKCAGPVGEYTEGCTSCTHRRILRERHARNRGLARLQAGYCPDCGYKKDSTGHIASCVMYP